MPRYVEQAFRSYLRCGVFAHGFLRWHCDHCKQDLFVAFSCKGRGVCPSCAARRMCNTAAHITDRVLPAVPLRQWVLSLPFELRRLCAFRSDAAAAIGRIFVEAITGELRREVGEDEAEHGAIVFPQRFGGSLNLHLHLHVLLLDGLFLRSDLATSELVFHDTGRPAIQNERGALAGAQKRGELRGLRRGVEALCHVLGIELTDERRRELARLDAAGLAALLARLQERKSWT